MYCHFNFLSNTQDGLNEDSINSEKKFSIRNLRKNAQIYDNLNIS